MKKGVTRKSHLINIHQSALCLIANRFISTFLFLYYIANVLNPPSTTATVPVTNFEASDIR